MKNPCEDCIVKANCTAICGEKNNYKTLIQHALSHRSIDMSHRAKYINLLTQTRIDEDQIIYRRRSLNCDDNF